MAKLKLWCGVYRHGSVFSVEIATDAEVEALQEAIVKKKKDVCDLFKVDPADLTLYLAQKNGEWLKDDESLHALLKSGPDKQFMKMGLSWKLSKKELFGDKFDPKEETIHILVELPLLPLPPLPAVPFAAGSGNPVLSQLVDAATRNVLLNLLIISSPPIVWSPAVPRPWLSVQPEDPLIRIPRHFLQGTGIGPRE